MLWFSERRSFISRVLSKMQWIAWKEKCIYLCPLQCPAVRQPENRHSAEVCWISSLSFPPIQLLFTSKNNILPSGIGLYAGAVTPRLPLVHNNAGPHVAGACQQFLDDEVIDSIDWPTCFPSCIGASASTSLHQSIQKLTDVLLQIVLMSYKITKKNYCN